MDPALAVILGVLVGAALGFSAAYITRRNLAQTDALWREERVSLLEAAAEERRELYTRIQAWEMPKEEEKPSQKPEEAKEALAPPIYTAEELAKLNLSENSDGGYVDKSTGDLWESVEDVREWRAELRKRGLPIDLSPSKMEIGGFAAALDDKKNRNS